MQWNSTLNNKRKKKLQHGWDVPYIMLSNRSQEQTITCSNIPFRQKLQTYQNHLWYQKLEESLSLVAGQCGMINQKWLQRTSGGDRKLQYPWTEHIILCISLYIHYNAIQIYIHAYIHKSVNEWSLCFCIITSWLVTLNNFISLCLLFLKVMFDNNKS